MPSSTHAGFRAGLLWANGLLLVISTGGLALPGGATDEVFVGLGLLAAWMSAAVCGSAVRRVGGRRWEVQLAAAAVISFAAGITYYGVVLSGGGSLPDPAPEDLGFLFLFYPLMLAALVVAVRHRVRGLALSVWLDSAVGSLGAGTVLAVLLSPVLSSAVTGPPSLATLVTVVFPMFDLLLVAAIAGIAALGGRPLGNRWGALVAGLLVFTATDVVYALQQNAGTYGIGTPLDAGWAIGLALIAVWVDGAARHIDPTACAARPPTAATALAVSSFATAAGLGVLILGTRTPLSTLAVVLAAVTLVAAAVRTRLSYRQLAWMTNLRRQEATTDDLTGLPNRRALYLEAGARLVDPLRRRQALLMLDLDRFKEVNDSLGHHTGDLLLIQVAARLRGHLRAGDLLARLGGDEFAVLLENAGHDEAAAVAVKLRAALAEPFAVEDFALRSTVSIGIALFPDDGPDLSSLLRKADVAMYKAKASGKGHHVYGGTDDAAFAGRLRMVDELGTALTTEQLVLHYQPKIDLNTGEVHGVEALVRWDHPTRGLLYPDAFLDLVEESGLMRTLTRVVLESALDQAAGWRARGQVLTIAVNLSASSLVDADLPDEVAAMLAARDLPPGALQLEITEEFLLADRDRAWAILSQLRRHGVQISVDDFGTGYNSLAYLRDLPIDELKLDRSFIFPMADNARAAAVVESTISLAHRLGLRIVAEGVETQVAYAELTHLGCDQAQGYFMSRPVPAAELDLWLSTRAHASAVVPEQRPPTQVR